MKVKCIDDEDVLGITEGREYKVDRDDGVYYYITVSDYGDEGVGYKKHRFEAVEEKKEEKPMSEIDQHYNFFYYLTPEDLDKEYIKIDPYFVASQWNFNKNDPSGAIFHLFKTCARYGMKNTKAREIEAMYKTIKRLAELEGIQLD